MKEENKEIEIVERYLKGEITLEEAYQACGFSSAESFHELVKSYELGRDDVVDSALHRDLQEIHRKHFGSSTTRKSVSRQYYMVAATLVLLAVFTYFMINREADHKPTFETFFRPYPNYDLSRNNTDEVLSKAMNFYAVGEFDSAELVFESMELDSVNFDYSFYKGLTYLANRSFKESVASLEPILNAAGNPYYQQTRWYLALAFWQEGDLAKTKGLLSSISAGEYNYDQAQKLLGLF